MVRDRIEALLRNPQDGELSLSELAISRLPAALAHLSALTGLHLTDCATLQNVTGLSNLLSLRRLDLIRCVALRILEDLSNLPALEELNLTHCTNLQNLEDLPERIPAHCRVGLPDSEGMVLADSEGMVLAFDLEQHPVAPPPRLADLGAPGLAPFIGGAPGVVGRHEFRLDEAAMHDNPMQVLREFATFLVQVKEDLPATWSIKVPNALDAGGVKRELVCRLVHELFNRGNEERLHHMGKAPEIRPA